MASATTADTINYRYQTEFAGSAAMHQRARNAIVGGITHDGRHIKPFPPYITHADGAYKWDVDGHKLIDYAIGHGSLILGHNDPDINEAMRDQIDRGTHFSAGHAGEVEWAEKVIDLVPSAERVRFTASGTESTLLAMRVARGYTERDTILKFEGHFHGWQDYALTSNQQPYLAFPVRHSARSRSSPQTTPRCSRSGSSRAILPPSSSNQVGRRGRRSRSRMTS